MKKGVLGQLFPRLHPVSTPPLLAPASLWLSTEPNLLLITEKNVDKKRLEAGASED